MSWERVGAQGPTACAAFVLLMVAGGYAVTTLPSGVYPEVTFPRIVIEAELPGISASNAVVQATRPLAMMFCIVSRRLLPPRSAIARCCGSSTRTNPLGPPRGETSALSSASNVPMEMNRQRSRNVVVAGSSSGRSFASTSGDGSR